MENNICFRIGHDNVRNLKEKNIYFGVLGNKILQSTINTHAHSKYYSRGYTMFPIGGGRRRGGRSGRLSDLPQPSAHSDRQHPLAVYRYILKSIYTTHTTIYTVQRRRKGITNITAETRKKAYIRTHTCRVEDSFLLPWPLSCHYHRQCRRRRRACASIDDGVAFSY